MGEPTQNRPDTSLKAASAHAPEKRREAGGDADSSIHEPGFIKDENSTLKDTVSEAKKTTFRLIANHV